ncbi:hypothetical protein [Maritimibacter sp. DP1N21-5]|uniref:hypothetical protein n=1 Tax=Maritimibacter sp. DP1N21-5 TaxID=2836867 RepID=UPI001C43ED36|nr:hypothetical protein [Maritimibacter sp. DP1N21-5]MBV7408716.1 hypothetical protein [Maritimibacter sp. DP1N21-5]
MAEVNPNDLDQLAAMDSETFVGSAATIRGHARELIAARAMIEAADGFYEACMSAWAAGEPKHKVEKMVKAAGVFEIARDAYRKTKMGKE